MPEIDSITITDELSHRNSNLDFLRGCAIFLVLLRHHPLFVVTQNVGWIGVDLFFVLSGFLVSGLLFKEYKKFGGVKPIYFLIRRGFKIYPLFYFSILISAIIHPFRAPGLNYKGLAMDYLLLYPQEIFFVQNYFHGIWDHHWSLAVEEHFYILLSILIYFVTKKGLLNDRKILIFLSTLIFVGCLLIRIAQNYFYPEGGNFFQTQLRIDSLFMGVFIGYFYHFYPRALSDFYKRFKYLLIVLFIIPFPFTLSALPCYALFIKTLGFTLIYLSFGSLLIIFLLSDTIKKKLPLFVTPFLYRAICLIGFYSYSIYLFHMYIYRYFCQKYVEDLDAKTALDVPTVLSFIVYFLGSIFLGLLASYLIEQPFLKMRDKKFPRRT